LIEVELIGLAAEMIPEAAQDVEVGHDLGRTGWNAMKPRTH
jgi:hypothetical protein